MSSFRRSVSGLKLRNQKVKYTLAHPQKKPLCRCLCLFFSPHNAACLVEVVLLSAIHRPALQSDAQPPQAAPLTSGGEEYRVLKVHGRNQLQTGEPVTCLWYFLVNSGGNGRGGVVLTPYSRYASMEA